MSTRGAIGIAVAVWALALSYAVRATPATLHAAAAAPAVAVPFPTTSSSSQTTAAKAPQPPANSDCMMCHEDESAARSDGRSVAVKPAAFEQSIHGGLACVDCHQDLATTAEFPHAEKLATVDCAACHSEAVEKYQIGIHATARERGSQVAATCIDCHGTHDIKPSSDPESRTYHLNIAATCARCHGNADVIARGGLHTDVTKPFVDSIHGRALSNSGLIVAPTCSNCYGAHDVMDPKDPKSQVARGNVPATCGRCHEGITRQFNAGVHGAMLSQGNQAAPACHTCHTAHAIQRSESPAWQLSVIGQCGTCHTDRLATFKDTFHGQVTTLGSRVVAGCADCHGAHEILAASDPRSPIAPANLVQTCRKCHEGASENFVKYDPHADKHNRDRNPMLFYISKSMTMLLAGVFSFFGIHTTLWFSKEWRMRRAARSAASTPPSKSTPGGRKEAGDDRAE